MIVKVTGGWTKDAGRNELDFKVTAVGDDANEVAHLQSIVSDTWTITNVAFANGELTMDVKATRPVSLAEQEAARAADEKAAADKAAAAAKVAADEAAKQNAADARVSAIASAAAKAAVEALTQK